MPILYEASGFDHMGPWQSGRQNIGSRQQEKLIKARHHKLIIARQLFLPSSLLCTDKEFRIVQTSGEATAYGQKIPTIEALDAAAEEEW
jgi:hypothetical protein